MREFNFASVIVGPPQMGKTTIARTLVRDHLAAGGWAFVHDPNRQFRDMCAVYDDAAAWRAAAAAAGKETPFPRGASLGGKATDVTQLAVDIGRAHNTADNIRVPIMLVYDESSLMGSSGGSYVGELDNALLSNRRHWGVGPVYNVQRPTALTEGFYNLATDVFILAQSSDRRTRVLEEYLGLPDGALDALVGAEPFTFRHWKAGKGLV